MDWFYLTDEMKNLYLNAAFGKMPIVWSAIFGTATIGAIIKIFSEGLNFWSVVGIIAIPLIALKNIRSLLGKGQARQQMEENQNAFLFCVAPIVRYSADEKRNRDSNTLIRADNCKIVVLVENEERTFPMNSTSFYDAIEYEHALMIQSFVNPKLPNVLLSKSFLQ